MLTGSFSQPAADNPTVALMEAAYRDCGVDARYLNCEVSPQGLGDAVRGARAMGWRGFNCSLPHKVSVIEHLDALAESASIIGAVNCVVHTDDGRLVGENTDGQGFLGSVREVMDLAGRHLLILGAGGAARACAVELALAGAASITVANRSPERGKALVDLLAAATPAAAHYLPWQVAVAVPPDVDLLVNATSIGLGDKDALPDVEMAGLRPGLVVADIIPNPPATALLRAAAAAGATTLDGLGMLVNQAAVAVRLWTGVEPDVTVMRSEAERVLGLR